MKGYNGQDPESMVMASVGGVSSTPLQQQAEKASQDMTDEELDAAILAGG
jgi:hypothetical protein